MKKVRFGSLRVGEQFQIGTRLCTKVEPVPCEVSRAFYATMSVAFHGWNARYMMYAGNCQCVPGAFSLADDVEVLAEG